MISWDGVKAMASASAPSIFRPNPFQMTAYEIGGQKSAGRSRRGLREEMAELTLWICAVS